MNRNFINLSWQVTWEKQDCGNISATRRNFHKRKWLQLNKNGKTQHEQNKIALSNCNHKYLSCNVIVSPSAKLYGASHQMEHCCNGIDPRRADVKLHSVCPLFLLKKKKNLLPHNSAAVPKLEKCFHFFSTRKVALLVFWNDFSTFPFILPLGQHLQDRATLAAEEGRRKNCQWAVWGTHCPSIFLLPHKTDRMFLRQNLQFALNTRASPWTCHHWERRNR